MDERFANPERHADLERNKILNQCSLDLWDIVHDPDIHNLNNRVWDRLDRMALDIEAHAKTTK